MTFDFALLKLEIDKNQENLKALINTQNPLKTSLNNLIWSNLVVLEPTLNFDQRLNKFNRLWRSFARFDYSVSQSDRLIITKIYKHKYFTTFYQSNGQILDLHLVSWWTHVVVPTYWETLINPLTQSDHSKWLKYTIKARKWSK